MKCLSHVGEQETTLQSLMCRDKNVLTVLRSFDMLPLQIMVE